MLWFKEFERIMGLISSYLEEAYNAIYNQQGY